MCGMLVTCVITALRAPARPVIGRAVIAWWPGKIKPGSVTSELACSLDMFDTCAKLAGVPLPNDRPMDSVDMTQLLLGKGPSQRDSFFYYYGDSLYAVRNGAFKAEFITHDGYSKEPAQPHDPPLLFHLPSDPSEQFDVAAAHPEVLAEMQREVEKHRSQLVPSKPQF